MDGNQTYDSRLRKTQAVLWVMLVILALIYASRLTSGFNFPDEAEYYRIASNLRHSHSFSIDGITPTALRPPGYPWLLFGVQALHESVVFAKMSSLPLWLLCIGLTAGLTRKFFGERAATLAMIFSLLYVVELYSSGTIYPQALASTLFLLSLWLHFVWRRSGQAIEIAVQSLVWALLILTVPTFIFNLLVYLLWLVWTKRSLKGALVIGLVTCLAVGAWSERNKVVFHSFFLSDNTGLMLFLGNSELTGPNTGPTLPLEQMVPKIWAQTDELVRDNSYKSAAVAWIKANPWRAAELYSLKLLNWFDCETRLKTVSKDSGRYQIIIALVYYPLFMAALLSPWFQPRSRRLELLFATHYVVAALVYAVFFTRIRYRLPYDYLILILAAGSVAVLLEGRTPLQRRINGTRLAK